MSCKGKRYKLKTKRETREFIEKKGCITATEICVNLGKAADLETGQEKYYCVRDFPPDCSVFGCPRLMPIYDAERWRLRMMDESELKTLRGFSDEVKRKKWHRRACTKAG